MLACCFPLAGVTKGLAADLACSTAEEIGEPLLISTWLLVILYNVESQTKFVCVSPELTVVKSYLEHIDCVMDYVTAKGANSLMVSAVEPVSQRFFVFFRQIAGIPSISVCSEDLQSSDSRLLTESLSCSESNVMPFKHRKRQVH